MECRQSADDDNVPLKPVRRQDCTGLHCGIPVAWGGDRVALCSVRCVRCVAPLLKAPLGCFGPPSRSFPCPGAGNQPHVPPDAAGRQHPAALRAPRWHAAPSCAGGAGCARQVAGIFGVVSHVWELATRNPRAATTEYVGAAGCGGGGVWDTCSPQSSLATSPVRLQHPSPLCLGRGQGRAGQGRVAAATVAAAVLRVSLALR
jgi:hypothetical protein